MKQKFLDSQGNEETQSQFEREANKEPQIRDPNLKIEKEKETENISKGNKNVSIGFTLFSNESSTFIKIAFLS